jgi:hypothetical protein
MATITTNLQLGIHLCQTNNCKTIKLSETTGSYDSSSNPGGWDSDGTDNPIIDDVTAINIKFKLPDASIWNFNRAFTSDLLPDSTGLIEVEFDTTDFGQSSIGSFDDGIYEVTYTVFGDMGLDNYEESVFNKFLLTCQTRCCIDKLFHAASQSDCKNEKLDKAIEADNLLRAAEYAALCGKFNMATKLLAKAQWICNTKNCLNC